jgi:hypothetical protein
MDQRVVAKFPAARGGAEDAGGGIAGLNVLTQAQVKPSHTAVQASLAGSRAVACSLLRFILLAMTLNILTQSFLCHFLQKS